MAKKPELDDFRVPFFDGGKKLQAVRPERDRSVREAVFQRDRRTSTASVSRQIGVQLDDLQEKLHAQRRQRVLLVLQGMDTSGKDGTIRAVFHDVDPLGLRIVPFQGADPSARPRTISCGASMRRRRWPANSRSSTAATTKTCSCRAC